MLAMYTILYGNIEYHSRENYLEPFPNDIPEIACCHARVGIFKEMRSFVRAKNNRLKVMLYFVVRVPRITL